MSSLLRNKVTYFSDGPETDTMQRVVLELVDYVCNRHVHREQLSLRVLIHALLACTHSFSLEHHPTKSLPAGDSLNAWRMARFDSIPQRRHVGFLLSSFLWVHRKGINWGHGLFLSMRSSGCAVFEQHTASIIWHDPTLCMTLIVTSHVSPSFAILLNIVL